MNLEREHTLSVREISRKMDNLSKNTFVQVSDNWYGCYDGNKIELTLVANVSEQIEDTYKWRIAILVTGNDDFGMSKERNFTGTIARLTCEYAEMLREYETIVNEEAVKSKEYFRRAGFIED